MWDRHRRIRHDSRKRALKAAHARIARRGGDTKGAESDAPAQSEAEQESAPAAPSPSARDRPAASDVDAQEPASETEPESTPQDPVRPHDPAGTLAWTGLIFLSLILGGFMAAVLFMLG